MANITFAMSLLWMWLIWTSVASGFTLTSDVTRAIVVNGVKQNVRTVTVDYTHEDEGHEFQLTTHDPYSGEDHVLTFIPDALVELYSRQLIGWIARAVYAYDNVVMLTDNPLANVTAMTAPSGDASTLDTDGIHAVLRQRLIDKAKDGRKLPQRYAKHKAGYKKKSEPVPSVNNQLQTIDRNLESVLRSNTFRTKTAVPFRRPSLLKTIQRAVATPVQGNPIADYDSGGHHDVTVGGVLKGTVCQFTDQILESLNDDWCSGDGGLRDAIMTIQNEVLQVQNEVVSLGDSVGAIQLWDNQEQIQTDRLLGIDQTLARQIGRLSNDVGINRRDIDMLTNVTFSLIARVTTEFDRVNAKLIELVENEARLLNLSKAIMNATQTQINALITQMSNIESQIMTLAMDLEQVYKHTQLLRAFRLEVWQQSINKPTELPSCVFSRCIGSAPMPDTGSRPVFITDQEAGTAHCPETPEDCSYLKNQVNLLNSLADSGNPDTPTSTSQIQNLYGAGVLSTVRLQYSTSTKAVERKISYLCDKIWALDNVVPNVDFRFLFRSMGPPKNASDSYCYGSSPGQSTWECHCVVVQTFSTCTLAPGAPIFPFGWTQTKSLHDSTQLGSYCTGSITDINTVAGESTLDSNAIADTATVYSDTDNWNSFLRALCESSSAWQQHHDGRKVRLASDTDAGFIDLTLFGNYTDVCNPDFVDVATVGVTDRLARISYHLYDRWARGYQTVQKVMLAFWDEQIYGTIMTETNALPRLFNSRPDVQQTGQEAKLRFIKYAGEGYTLTNYSTTLANLGFDADPEHLDSDNVVDNNYPPLPQYTPAYNELGNPTKLPVYSIAPVTRHYAPKLVIDNGDCTVVDGKCVANLGGVNFTAALNVKVDTKFDRLLPKNRMVVGDYSLGDPMVLDIPEDMLPEVYEHEVTCKTLLYLMQRRTSPHVLNPDFNIPDTDWTTPINARDWLRVYKTTFDPFCASASAMRYARAVDSQGKCQERVNDRGESVNVKPGNFDWCTLMEFWKVVVPNYVHAYMEFHAREYTATAEFVIPAGILTESVDTSCPTSYEVALSADGEYRTITFYTTQTTDQRATMKVNSFGSCSGLQDDFTFSASVPFTPDDIKYCGKQYVQVYPYLSNQGCYSEPGIEIYLSHTSNSGPIVPSEVQTAIINQQDRASQSIADLLVKAMIAQYDIMRIPLLAQSADDVINQYSEQIGKHIDNINSINTSFVDGAEQLQKQQYQQQIQNDSSRVLADLVAQEQDQKTLINQTIEARAGEMIAKAINEQAQKQVNFTRVLINETDDLIKEEAQRVRNDLDREGGGSDCSYDWFPLLGPLLCSLLNGFGSIGRIITWCFIFIIIVCLIGVCARSGCCGAMFSGISKAFEKKPSADPKPTDTPAPKGRFRNRTRDIELITREEEDEEDYETSESSTTKEPHDVMLLTSLD